MAPALTGAGRSLHADVGVHLCVVVHAGHMACTRVPGDAMHAHACATMQHACTRVCQRVPRMHTHMCWGCHACTNMCHGTMHAHTSARGCQAFTHMCYNAPCIHTRVLVCCACTDMCYNASRMHTHVPGDAKHAHVCATGRHACTCAPESTAHAEPGAQLQLPVHVHSRTEAQPEVMHTNKHTHVPVHTHVPMHPQMHAAPECHRWCTCARTPAQGASRLRWVFAMAQPWPSLPSSHPRALLCASVSPPERGLGPALCRAAAL